MSENLTLPVVHYTDILSDSGEIIRLMTVHPLSQNTVNDLMMTGLLSVDITPRAPRRNPNV